MQPRDPRESRSVQRVVQSGVVHRKGADAPELGQVDRVRQAPRTESCDPKRRALDKGGQRREGLRKAIILGWSLALVLMAAGVLIGTFVWSTRKAMKRPPDQREAQRQAKEERVKIPSAFKSPLEDEARDIVRRALAAQTEAEVVRWIRTGTTPALEVAKQLAAIQAADGKTVEENWLGSIDANGILLEGVERVFDSQDRTKNRLAMLTPDGQGVWKMDFAAYARCGEPSWEKLLAEGPTSGVVRVWVERDGYYNGPYADDADWDAYALASQDTSERLLGYCKRLSPQHRAMVLMRENTQGATARATLQIRRVEGAERRQFEVVRVLAEDWVMTDVPFDLKMEGEELPSPPPTPPTNPQPSTSHES